MRLQAEKLRQFKLKGYHGVSHERFQLAAEPLLSLRIQGLGSKRNRAMLHHVGNQ